MSHGGSNPRPPAYVTPAIVLGSAPAAGNLAGTIRGDATIQAFDGTAPSTQAFSDAAAVGSAAYAARRDHKHAMMANPLPANSPGGLAQDGSGNIAWLRSLAPPNAVVNGSFEVAQVYATAGFDMWTFGGVGSWTASFNSLTSPPSNILGFNFSSYADIVIGTADASVAAGDLMFLQQKIEGWNCRDLFSRGAALHFLCYCTITGTFAVALINRAGTYTYIREFSIPVANTWTAIGLTFPTDTLPSITGNGKDNIGLYLQFCFMCGSDYQAAKDSWVNANKAGTSAVTNLAGTTGNTLYLAGINLIPGQTPLPYVAEPYDKILHRCQRYRQIIAQYPMALPMGQAISSTTINGGGQGLLVPMVTTPSATISSVGHFVALDAGGTNRTLGSLSFTFNKEMFYYSASATNLVAGNAVTVYGSNGSALVYADAVPG